MKSNRDLAAVSCRRLPFWRQGVATTYRQHLAAVFPRFWHRPQADSNADWQSLEDVAVQIRDGRTGEMWDPTARHIYVYTPKPLDESLYRGYSHGPRQYNPRLMD